MMKPEKTKLNGWVNLDKPVGLSSTQAMAKVRWLFNAAKSGHGGTLDPFATGVLPIALGDATKLLQYVLDGSKSYRFTIRWGEARNTDDCTGTVTQTLDRRPDKNAIEEALKNFKGTIAQIPPQFSAIHVDGKRAYDLARKGEVMELEARHVTLNRFVMITQPSADEAVFEVDCTKGTYVRSLARDLGATLGCFGHVKTLIRLASGPFQLENTISLEKLEEMRQNSANLNEFQAKVLPLTTALDDIPALAANEQEASRLRQGQSVKLHPTRLTPELQNATHFVVKDRYGLVAIAAHDGTEVKPIRVFKPSITGVPDVAKSRTEAKSH